MAAALLAVVAVLSGVLVVGAVSAPAAYAQAGTCTKTADGAGVLITAAGFEDGDRAAIRRNGKWVVSEAAAGLSHLADGDVNDDWTLRVRGAALPDPYLTIACEVADPVDANALCAVVEEDGALRAELSDFADGDRLSLRRNGRWVSTFSGAVDVVDDLPGTAGDSWTVRARGAAFDVPYSTIACTVQIVDPPPNPETFCRVTAGGLEWDDAGVDVYQVRRNGKWVTSTDAHTYATDDLEAVWVIRYSLGFGKVEEPCGEAGPQPDSCIISGQLVESIMNGPQCVFAEQLLDPDEGHVAGNVVEPCVTDAFDCRDGQVVGIITGARALPDGLRFFPDLDYLDLRRADVPALSAEVGQLSKLRTLLAMGSNLASLPPEIGQLDNLEYLVVGSTELTELPAEIGDMDSLREMSAYDNPGLTTIPADIYQGRSIELIDLGASGITSMPVATVEPPSLRRVALTRTPLVGDQTDWLVSLGPAFDIQVYLEPGPPCEVWTTDASWDEWLEQLEPKWAGCGAPEEPEPPAAVACRIITNGLEWDDAGADGGLYHVRRNGKWVENTTNLYAFGDTADGAWSVRYRIDGERRESSCENTDPGPCMIGGVQVDSIMNGFQCNVAEALNPGLAGDPCLWGDVVCEDGAVTALEILNGTLPDGLRHFPDLTALYFYDGDFGVLPAELGHLADLQSLSFFNTQATLPPEVGNLDDLRLVHFEDESVVSLPAEFGDLPRLAEVSFFMNTATTEVPLVVFDLPSLRVLDLELSSISSLPPEVSNATSLEQIRAGLSEMETLPSEALSLPNLKTIDLFGAAITQMPVSDGEAADGLAITLNDTALVGDQTDWLVALGDPTIKGLTVWFDAEAGCEIWTTDAAWNAKLLDQNAGWSNCQPPE